MEFFGVEAVGDVGCPVRNRIESGENSLAGLILMTICAKYRHLLEPMNQRGKNNVTKLEDFCR